MDYIPKPENSKCSWRQVAETDLEKIANGDPNVTFSGKKECFDCNGYDMSCKAYYVVKTSRD